MLMVPSPPRMWTWSFLWISTSMRGPIFVDRRYSRTQARPDTVPPKNVKGRTRVVERHHAAQIRIIHRLDPTVRHVDRRAELLHEAPPPPSSPPSKGPERVDRLCSARTFFSSIPSGTGIRRKYEESTPVSPHRLEDGRWIGCRHFRPDRQPHIVGWAAAGSWRTFSGSSADAAGCRAGTASVLSRRSRASHASAHEPALRGTARSVRPSPPSPIAPRRGARPPSQDAARPAQGSASGGSAGG